MKDKKQTILFVEDEEALLKAVDIGLRNAGYKTILAPDGEQGLKEATEHKPDLILLDIKMPKMDGLTMLKKLRNDPAGKDIPVIILTNWSDMDKISKAVELHTKYYLVKTDWDVDEIIKKVKEALSNGENTLNKENMERSGYS
jgi:DNA-binding response OmpR family regulator